MPLTLEGRMQSELSVSSRPGGFTCYFLASQDDILGPYLKKHAGAGEKKKNHDIWWEGHPGT